MAHGENRLRWEAEYHKFDFWYIASLFQCKMSLKEESVSNTR